LEFFVQLQAAANAEHYGKNCMLFGGQMAEILHKVGHWTDNDSFRQIEFKQ